MTYAAARRAQAWANKLVSEKCAFYHGGYGDMGQNLFWASWPADCATAVSYWVNEKAYYRYGVFPKYCKSGQSCGHYTQVRKVPPNTRH